MDDDTTALIALLCTRIGMIMEDMTVTALTIGHCEPDLLPAALDRVEGAAIQINLLIGATKALLL
jgi:hypothetical protein